jgi:hypothetical protein
MKASTRIRQENASNHERTNDENKKRSEGNYRCDLEPLFRLLLRVFVFRSFVIRIAASVCVFGCPVRSDVHFRI